MISGFSSQQLTSHIVVVCASSSLNPNVKLESQQLFRLAMLHVAAIPLDNATSSDNSAWRCRVLL